MLLGGAEIDFTHNGSATPVAETGTASAARGLPDLGTAIAVDGGALYRAAEEPGHFLHVASALRVAGLEDGSGLPDLSLELVRGKTPSTPPKPYGVLDLRVAAGEPAPGALEAARGQDPRAFITPALFGNGFVRLQVVAGQGALAPALREELAQPVAIASNGLDSTRLIRRLTPEAALLLRGALIDGALTVVAVAELSLRGLAERLPATVTFSPRTLLDALLQRADSQQRIAVSAITDLWAGGAPLLASTGTDGVERRQLAQALTDWTIAAYAVPAAAPGAEVAPTVQLKRPATFEPKLTWDLSRGRTTTRMLVLRLDPFEAARELGGEQFWHETVVPALETGITQIDVDTNFPHPMVNVARAGVQMRAAPFPPDRVNELSAGLLFDAREAPQAVKWRLSAKEQLKYTYACFALVRLGSTTKRLDKPTVTSTARRLLLGVDDLPVDLVPFAAGERLLADASVHGALTDGTTRVEFALTSAQPRVSVALLPGTAERFSLALEARPLAGGAPVALAPLPARSLKLDVSSFPQYGPQTVDVTVDFDIEVPLVALELLPERDGDDATKATVLALAPDEPRKQFTYLNPTPFDSGYRYRVYGSETWSEVRPAGSTLALRASEVAEPAGGGDLEFEDLYCFPASDPDSALRDPTPPRARTRPERAADGDGARAPGRHRIADARGAPGPGRRRRGTVPGALAERDGVPEARLTLRVAPIEVTAVVLSIADADGESRVLSRKKTSNYPPFTALFSETLDSDGADAFKAALAGSEGRALVHFDARYERRFKQSAVVRGDLGPVIARVRAASGDRAAAARHAVEEALAAGALRATLDSAGLSQEELLERVVDSMVPLIEQLSAPGNIAGTPTELRFTYQAPSWRDLSSTIDVATWFAARSLPELPAP